MSIRSWQRQSVVAWRAGVPRSRGAPTSTPFHGAAERTPSRESASNGPSGRGKDDRWRLGGLGPSQPRCADINTISRRRRSGRPPGNRPAMSIRSWQRRSVGLEGRRDSRVRRTTSTRDDLRGETRVCASGWFDAIPGICLRPVDPNSFFECCGVINRFGRDRIECEHSIVMSHQGRYSRHLAKINSLGQRKTS